MRMVSAKIEIGKKQTKQTKLTKLTKHNRRVFPYLENPRKCSALVRNDREAGSVSSVASKS